jgi:hypothetical protein
MVAHLESTGEYHLDRNSLEGDTNEHIAGYTDSYPDVAVIKRHHLDVQRFAGGSAGRSEMSIWGELQTASCMLLRVKWLLMAWIGVSVQSKKPVKAPCRSRSMQDQGSS